ncbi:MAG: glycosyltransferase family 4 protein [Anaerolineae bacterium]|nr:glycosyltransferase family 4 protein [Anaerolineae bacterium]
MKRLNFICHRFIPVDGYGRYGLHLVRALTRLGVDVFPGMVIETRELPSWMLRLKGYDFSKLNLMLMPGHEMISLPGRVWGYSMYEDSSIPKGWAQNINAVCERLLVPCEHNAEVFERRGVKIPIHVVHGGTAPEEFPVLTARPKDRPYTFVCLGDRGDRKGVEIAWMAFFEAFPNEQDVRLVIKTRKASLLAIQAYEDRRMSVWADDLDFIGDVFAQADVALYPAYGDGWGMWPREAAMSGLPAIVTRWSGLEVGIDHWALPLNNFHMQASTLESVDGQWAVPDVHEVAERMRWCYEHQDEAKAFGVRAAQWLREHQTWEHTAQSLIDLIERHG